MNIKLIKRELSNRNFSRAATNEQIYAYFNSEKRKKIKNAELHRKITSGNLLIFAKTKLCAKFGKFIDIFV